MKKILLIIIACTCTALVNAQNSGSILGKTFEEPKIDGSTFNNVKVNVGGDFALQFQSLKHHADSLLIPIGGNINLPSANMSISADLAPGIKVNLETYLASRHHNDTWVKGGYLIIDQLPFLHSETANKIMQHVTVKIGDMEINYGDNHFYRSDNGHVINNPFVGNFILDGFLTSPAAEIYYRNHNAIVMGGITAGALNPALGGYNSKTKAWMPYNLGKQLEYYFKLSYDKTINDNIRIRPTISGIFCPHTYGGPLYADDRAGSRYYLVMNKESLGTANAYDITQNVANGYFGPGSFTKNTSVFGNLYAWVYGLEIFGGYEMASGQNGVDIYARDYKFNSMNIQGVYYFGKDKQFDLGVRYNKVIKDAQPEQLNPVTETVMYTAVDKMSTNRIQVAGGWKMTKNIYAKAEYVKQSFSNFINYGLGSAGFEGLMVEATISF